MLTIIVCVFNEISLIEKSINELKDCINAQDHNVEVIVLDNRSEDGTREWLNKFKDPKFQVILNESNLGKGGSIKKGIRFSRGNYIVIHDPDLEYRASDIWKLLENARKTKATFILGSRLLANKPHYKYLRTYLGVLFLTGLIRILFRIKITDAATALKLMEGDFARNLNLVSNGFNLDFELITRTARLGGSFSEVKAYYEPRSFKGGKKIKPFKDGLSSLLTIIRDRFLPKQSLLRFAN